MASPKFQFLQRWSQIGELFKPKMSSEMIELLDQRDRDLEDYLTGAERPIKTFNKNGALSLTSSDRYGVPYSPKSGIWTGSLTTYGSGTVTVTLNRRRVGSNTVIATLSLTAANLLYVVPAQHQWLYGDLMWAEITGAGTGCAGFVGEVI